jgi:raffinose/stachyose/melibiose transport system permease protein
MGINFKTKGLREKTVNFLLSICLVVWAIIQIFPLYWLITFSLKDNADIFGGNIVGIPKEFIWKNYEKAFVNGKIVLYLMNSVIVTSVTIILTVIFSLMAAYALTRMKWKFRNSTLILFMMGLMIPIHAALLPILLMLRQLKLLNSYWSLIIPYVAFAIPMAIVIFTGFIKSIPKELEESASIDGGSIYRIFFNIILPLMKPAMSTVAIFTFLQSWNELMFAVVFISKQSYKTLTVGIQSMSGQYVTEWGPIGAALVVATLPTIIIYLCMSNQVQKSLVVGAVKG